MKLLIVVLVALFCSIASCELVLAKKKIGREVFSEPNAIDIEYLGTCTEFAALASFISVNEHANNSLNMNKPPDSVNCLPIADSSLNYGDYNDLRAEYICNPAGKRRSIIRIVEVMDPVNATLHNDDLVNGHQFTIGIISNKPFRAAGATYYKRPSCAVTVDYCRNTQGLVHSCTSNSVTTREGFVLDSDKVYIAPQTNTIRVDTCTTTSSGSPACCVYVAPRLVNGLSGNSDYGICPNSPNGILNELPLSVEANEHHNDYDNNVNPYSDDK